MIDIAERLKRLVAAFGGSSDLAARAVSAPRQAAALIERPGSPGREILLVTSRDTGRWILPKGWIEPGESATDAAIREAWEEAGAKLRGGRPIGPYRYEKRRMHKGDVTCDVLVVHFTDITLDDRWPERDMRERRWVAASQAAQMVDEPQLRDIIIHMARDKAA